MQATATRSQIEGFQLKAGDVLITKDSESWDDIAVPAFVPKHLDSVLCGYHLALIRPDPTLADGEFLFRCFAAEGICDQFRIAANGITRFGLDTSSLNDAVIPLPPLEEQIKIAILLRRETCKIDTLICSKQRLIELLHEKRTALISRAVTKGLDRGVPMKDSHTIFLLQVPAHWKVGELRREWNVIDCKHRTATYVVENGIPIVSTTEVKPGRLDLVSTRLTTPGEFRDLTEGGRLPKRGDIIYSRNASLGSAAYVDTDAPFCMGQDVCMITSQDNNQLFLTYQLSSSSVLGQLNSLMVGATFQRINIGQIQKFLVTCPPRDEQDRIANYLDIQTGRIDRLIAKVRTGMETLREYRTALISAAVTGKIDVRGEAE
jgi:type I restriction enzyme, S subunit